MTISSQKWRSPCFGQTSKCQSRSRVRLRLYVFVMSAYRTSGRSTNFIIRAAVNNVLYMMSRTPATLCVPFFLSWCVQQHIFPWKSEACQGCRYKQSSMFESLKIIWADNNQTFDIFKEISKLLGLYFARNFLLFWLVLGHVKILKKDMQRFCWPIWHI